MIHLLLFYSFIIRILSETYEIKNYFNSITYNSSKTINLYYKIENNLSQLGIITFFIHDSSIYSLTEISIKSKQISLNSNEEIPLNFPIYENSIKQYLLKEVNNIDTNVLLEKEKMFNLYLYYDYISNDNESKIDYLLIEVYLNKSNNDSDSILYFVHSKNQNVNIENNSNGKIDINNLEIFSYFLIHFKINQIDEGNFFFQFNNDLKNIYIENFNSNFEGEILPFNDYNLLIKYNKKLKNEIMTIGFFYLSNSFIIDKKNFSLSYFFSKYDYFINDYDFDKQKLYPIQIESCFKPIHFIFNLSKNDNFSYFIINEKIFGEYNIYNKQLNESIQKFNNNSFEFNRSFVNNDFIEIFLNYSVLKYEFLYPSILNIRLIKIRNIILENEVIIGENISSIYHLNYDINNNFKFILTSQMYKKIQIKLLNNLENINISINYLNETKILNNTNILYEFDLKQDNKSFIVSNMFSNKQNYLIEIIQKKEDTIIELVTLEEEKNITLNTSYIYINITSIPNLFNYKILFERNFKNFLNYTYIYSISNSDFYINKNLSSSIYPLNFTLKILNPFKYNFEYYLILIKFPSKKPTKLIFSINKPINIIYPNSFININQNNNKSSNFTIISNFKKSDNKKILFQFFNQEQNENRILNNQNQKLKFQLYDINMEKISYNETKISINNNIATFNSYNYFSDYILIYHSNENLFFNNLFLYISFINPKNFNESNYEEKNLTLQITNETNANIKIPKINKSNISISTKFNIYISENLSLSKYDIFTNKIEPNDSILINQFDNNSNYEYHLKNLQNNTEYILYILNKDEQTYYIYNKLIFKTGKEKENLESNEKNNSNNLPYYWIILLIIICIFLICIFLLPILYYCYYLRKDKIKKEENFDNNDLESENKNTKAYPSSVTIDALEGRHGQTRLSTNMSFNNALHKHK